MSDGSDCPKTLVFAAAVIVIAPTFNMKYGELLPYATPGFIAFGAGSLLKGGKKKRK